MTMMKGGSPLLYSDNGRDILGINNPDGTDSYFISSVNFLSEIPANANGVYRLPSGELLSYVNGVSIKDRPNTNRVGFVGDSITAGGKITGSTYGLTFYGFSTVATVLSGKNVNYAGNIAVGGTTVDQIITSVATIPNNYADYIVCLAGTNGVGLTYPSATLTAAQLIERLEVLWAAIKAKGAQPIICTIPPNNSAGRLIDWNTLNAEVNEYIRNKASEGYIVFDLYKYAVANGITLTQTPTYTGWRTGASTDGLHPNGLGSYLLGRAFARDVLSTLPGQAVDLSSANNALDPYCLNPNPNLYAGGGVGNATGVNGFITTGTATGTGPHNWTVNGTAGSALTCACAAGTDYQDSVDFTSTMTFVGAAAHKALGQDIQIKVWAASATKVFGDIIRPTVANGCWYKVILLTGGALAATEGAPWSTVIGDTFNHGTTILMVIPELGEGSIIQGEVDFEITQISAGAIIPILTLYSNDNAFSGLTRPAMLDFGQEITVNTLSPQVTVTGATTDTLKWPTMPSGIVTMKTPPIKLKRGTGADFYRFGLNLQFSGDAGTTTATVKVSRGEIRILSV